MTNCTCTKDREVTCIVHPTERALHDYIAQQQARIEGLEAQLKRTTEERDDWEGRYTSMYAFKEQDDARAQLASLRKKHQWLIDNCNTLTGSLWPQNETTKALADLVRKAQEVSDEQSSI